MMLGFNVGSVISVWGKVEGAVSGSCRSSSASPGVMISNTAKITNPFVFKGPLQ
jgi:hypothetical protein